MGLDHENNFWIQGFEGVSQERRHTEGSLSADDVGGSKKSGGSTDVSLSSKSKEGSCRDSVDGAAVSPGGWSAVAAVLEEGRALLNQLPTAEADELAGTLSQVKRVCMDGGIALMHTRAPVSCERCDDCCLVLTRNGEEISCGRRRLRAAKGVAALTRQYLFPLVLLHSIDRHGGVPPLFVC